MAPSYNIGDLPLDTLDPDPEHVKETRNLFDTISITSTASTNLSAFRFRGKRLLILGLGICLSIILLVLGVALQVFLTNEYLRQGYDIITTAPLGLILANACVLGVLLLVTIPLVLALDSYRLAWTWLEASVDNGHNRPTPFQLGLLMKVLHGANPRALWEVTKYIHGFGSSTKPSYTPPVLRRAFVVLALTLGLAYFTDVLLVIFGATSKTMSFSQLGEYQGTWPQLSRQINGSLCTSTGGAVAQGINLCGLETTGNTPFAASLPEALHTLTNNSAMNALAFANDGSAIIVPASIPGDIAYSGTSYGVVSTCQSVTDQCIGSGSSYGASESLTLNCPASVFFNAAVNSSTGLYPFGILDGNGNEYSKPYMVNSNPFRFGAVVVSQAYFAPADKFVGNTGFFAHGAPNAYNALTCSVTVRTVGYTYFNGSFTVDPSNTYTTSDLDISRIIAAMTSTADLSMRVPAAIEGAGLSGGDYASAFARELSRELIAFSASLYEPAAPLQVNTVVPVLGSRLPLVLLIMLLICIGAYCLLVLFVTVSAVLATSASPYTMLARNRIADPMTAVNVAYGRAEPHRTWEQENHRLFSVETGLDRLSIGPTTSKAGGLAFGISRAVVAPGI
ncbi:hypothetical protein R3P38DRAFT_2956474 [Favolaschia claudopus]|uniref:Uncharacterized protein n=1 Tax=Favolaschia claudopus TaxID=2862362 RepID=A0AAW0BET1_9AGAR